MLLCTTHPRLLVIICAWYGMNPSRTVAVTEQTAECGMDGWTGRWRDEVKPIYTQPTTSLFEGYDKRFLFCKNSFYWIRRNFLSSLVLLLKVCRTWAPRPLGPKWKAPWDQLVWDISWRLLGRFSWFKSHMALCPRCTMAWSVFTTGPRVPLTGPRGQHFLWDPIYVNEYWADFAFMIYKKPYGNIQHYVSFYPRYWHDMLIVCQFGTAVELGRA